jgi:hypothetical protein
MKRNSLILLMLLVLGIQTAMAKDEFGEVVSHIESHYHVHRNSSFLMGFAGLVVRVSHVGGVKAMKTAIFEDRQFTNSGSDTEFDEVMRKALNSGWRPVVRTYSRHSGEHTYIYAKSDGRDLKILLATLEPSEAVVMQLKVDPGKLEAFINEHSSPGRHHRRMKHQDQDDDGDESARAMPAPPMNDEAVCMFFGE